MREAWRDVALGDIFQETNLRLGAHDGDPAVFSVTKYDGVVLAQDFFGKRIASEKLDGYKVLHSGDWAYSTIHIDEGSIALNRQGRVGVVSPMYTTMQFRSAEALPDYCELVLRSPKMLARYSDVQQGSINRRRSLPWKVFATLTIPLPSLPEQRRIMDLIGAVDDAVRKGTEAAFRLEMLWWRIADDLRVSVAGQPVKLLGAIADIGGGLTKNKKDIEHPDAVEAPYLRVANVLRRRLDLRDVAMITAPVHRIEAARLMPGDVLMNEGGDKDKLGRGAVWRGAVKDCTHQNHVFRVRVRDDRFSPEFLSAWANSFGQKWFETHGTQTTGIASINKSTLGRFPVPDIDLSEQQRWAELLQGVTDQEDEYRAQARRLQRLRSSLLDVLLSGEHEIPDSYDELMGVAS